MSTSIPATFLSATPRDGVVRPEIFDPALKHFGAAFRAGDPQISQPEVAARWQQARRSAVDHVLTAMAQGSCSENLVLRGSRLLKAWLEDKAREPRDLDWVVRPATHQHNGALGRKLIDDVVKAVLDRPSPAGTQFLVSSIAMDDIWTYERATGRRIVFPWRVDGLPSGVVQVDIVFGEQLPEPPIQTAIRVEGGDTVQVWSATPGLSLAWKLLWLTTDWYPQGKDMFDAVIQAEQAFVPRSLLSDLLRMGQWPQSPSSAAEMVGNWHVEWSDFHVDNPWASGNVDEWKALLIALLKPTFATCPQPAQSQVIDRAWRSAEVTAIATSMARTRRFSALPVLADALEEAGCDSVAVLEHCRSGCLHTDSCWVVDWLVPGA